MTSTSVVSGIVEGGIVAPNVCANCGASDDSSPDGVKLKPCSVCKTATYCGRGCQVEHWKAHKPHCTAETPAARAAARAAALADLPDLVPLPGAPDLVSCLSSLSSWRFDAAVGLVPLEVYNTWRAAEAQRLSAMHKEIARDPGENYEMFPEMSRGMLHFHGLFWE